MADITLVYQPVPPDGRSNAFADAIGRIVEPADAIALVSPYLAHSILTAVIGARDFRLVTDVEACLEGGAEPALARFLAQHHEAIRDVRGVHAKVVIGRDLALLGSANLTTQGLCSRFEMGCLVRDESAISELRQWFEELWTFAAPLDVAKIEAATITSRAAASPSGDGSTPLAARTGNLGWLAGAARDSAPSRGRTTGPAPSKVAAEDLDELSRRLRSLTRSRAEARHLLGMLRRALEVADLAPDDDRLHLNFSRSRRISISIGQRHVAWGRATKEVREFGMMLDDFDLAERTAAAIAGARVDAYTKNSVPVVPELYVPVSALQQLSTEVLESWGRAIRRHVSECGKSSYRDKKRVALYDMLLDDDLRAEAIRAAHPSAWWFGVNNGRRGHMQLADLEPLFDANGGELRWPVGRSKTEPRSAYADTLPGDPVLLWTGHGQDPQWGVLGTATVSRVSADHITLRLGQRFSKPVTPYPKGEPADTDTVRFLVRVLGEHFKPLGDVRQAVYGEGRTNPVTVAQVPEPSFQEIVAFATSR